MCRTKPMRRMLHPLMVGLALAALPAAHAHPGPGARAAGGVVKVPRACLPKREEDQLKARELALLGPRHADEHAESRNYRCLVAKGLKQQAPGPGPAALAFAALPPARAGQWSGPFTIPIVGIAAVLLNNAKVLFWSYDPAHWEDPGNSNRGVSYVWDPASRDGAFIPAPENIWCGGQTILADGRLFLAGGNLRYGDPHAPPGQRGWQGDPSTYTFNPATSRYIQQPEMAHGRWYPTVTQLPDNSAIIAGGFDETGSENANQLVERFTPSTAIDGVGTIGTVASHKNMPALYPFQYVLPSGSMLQAGPEAKYSRLLNPADWSWSRLPNMLYDHRGNANGIHYTDASVTPASQIVLVSGGISGRSNNEWLDGYNPAEGWSDYPKWNRYRHNANTIILPDGKLLTVGGNAARTTYDDTLYSTELYSMAADDLNGDWAEVAPHSLPAAYHSSAILLPDATVLLSEDDRNKSVEAAANHRAQIYSPPYLFKGARPTLSAPAAVTLGQSFAIAATAAASRTIVSAVLIAPGAVTHGNDMHQRFIKLPVSVNGTSVTATVPASAALVPPGYYMLFIVDSEGVPSIASFVHAQI